MNFSHFWRSLGMFASNFTPCSLEKPSGVFSKKITKHNGWSSFSPFFNMIILDYLWGMGFQTHPSENLCLEEAWSGSCESRAAMNRWIMMNPRAWEWCGVLWVSIFPIYSLLNGEQTEQRVRVSQPNHSAFAGSAKAKNLCCVSQKWSDDAGVWWTSFI